MTSEICDLILSPAVSNHDKLISIQALLQRYINERVVPDLIAFITFLLEKAGDSNPITRPAVSEFVNAIEKIEDDSALEEVCKCTLSLMQNKMIFYGDDFLKISVLLSEIYQANKDFSAAAKVLSFVSLDHVSEVGVRVDALLRIAELYLEDDDAISASRFVTKAHRLISQCSQNLALVIRHKRVYAQVLDFERKFMDAALRYVSLGQMDCPEYISNDDQMIALQHAAICCILAGAGPSRSRVLAILYQDERSRMLPTYSMLEAMHLNKVINVDQQVKFKQLLKPHQDAELSGGSSVLQRAVLEHNIMAVSKIYNNISLASLSGILHTPTIETESIAATMIEQGRLIGSIDQVDGNITFENVGNTSTLQSWDSAIRTFCQQLNDVADQILDKYPEVAI